MATQPERSSLWNSSTENFLNTVSNALGPAKESTYYLIFGTILLIASAITIAANGIVIVVTLKDPLKNLRVSPSNYLVLCLACTDFPVGAVQELLHGTWLVNYYIHNVELFPTSVVFTIRTLLLTTSMSTLLALGFDGMIAVRSPLRYKNIVTLKKVRIAMVCVWVYSLLHGVLYGSLFDSNFFLTNTVFLGSILITFLIMLVIYAVLTWSVRKQSAYLKGISDSQSALKNAIERQKKVTSTIFVILSAFKIGFFPYVVCFLLLSLCNACNLQVLAVALPYASWLMYINSLVNPFIYAYNLPKYKQAFKFLMTERTTPARQSFRKTTEKTRQKGGLESQSVEDSKL